MPVARTAVPADMKRCSKCGIEKPRSEFSRHKRKADGLQGECKACVKERMRAYYKANKERINAANMAHYTANREAVAEQRKKDRAANPEKHRAQKRKSMYGVSAEMYAHMVARSKGRCEVCDKPPTDKGLHIDHCHESGAVRGLLCHHCNLALGHFCDDARVMRAAIDYVERHQEARLLPKGSPHDALEVQAVVQVKPE